MTTVAPALSIVIPAYRSGQILPTLVAELDEVLGDRDEDFEIVVVHDGSPDDTWQAIRGLEIEHGRLRLLDLMTNHGQAMATMCGLDAAAGDIVVTMDDDRQHPADQIPILVDELRARPELDAVVGAWPRSNRLWRRAGSAFYSWLDRMAWGTPRGFRHTALRAIRRPLVDAIVEHETHHPAIGPLMQRLSGRVANVAVRHEPRTVGASGFTFGRGLRWALDNFAQGSTAPLRTLSALGFVAAAISMILAASVTLRWSMGSSPPPGWLSVFLAVVFFGGASLMSFGVLGEYVTLLVRESERRPRWRVREQLDRSGDRRVQPVVSRGIEEPLGRGGRVEHLRDHRQAS